MAYMTREEAEKMLEYIRETGNGESPYRHCRQSIALDFAISDMKKIEKYEQAMEKMLAEINTPNRGTCDYYIVDQIENIINGLRKEVL